MQESALKAFDVPMLEIFLDAEFNSRGAIVPIDVIDLAKSIKDHGLQQAIVVQPWDKVPGKKWRIVSGHRRFMAFRLNNSAVIPAVIQANLTELDARRMNLEENIQRKSLNILQEAKALVPFWQAGWTEQMVASEFKLSRGWAQARRCLIKLPEEIQAEAAAGFLTQEQIKQLSSIKNKEEQFAAVKKIKNAKLLGESRPIRAAPKKRNPLVKRERSAAEIHEMQTHVREAIGNNFGTFCMGWAAGHNSDLDLYEEIKKLADLDNIPYNIPQEAREAKAFK